MEKTGEEGFSGVLTARGISDLRQNPEYRLRGREVAEWLVKMTGFERMLFSKAVDLKWSSISPAANDLHWVRRIVPSF